MELSVPARYEISYRVLLTLSLGITAMSAINLVSLFIMQMSFKGVIGIHES